MEAIHGSKNGPYMRAIMGHTWKQEWAIHGSRTWEPYMEARMGHTWEPYMGAVYGSRIWKQEWAICESNNGPYMGAIHGSKNGPHVRAIMGHTWKQEWAICESNNGPYMGAIHGSKNGPHVRAIMGHTWELYMGAVYCWKSASEFLLTKQSLANLLLYSILPIS